jgi:hypothetical protein
VRGHYFDWLAGARPELVGLHRRRFRRGAYQADDARERVEGIVREAARRCGVTGRDRYRARAVRPEEETTPRPREAGPAQQLRLL